MKECFKCHTVKPLSEFYAHKKMQDGHLNKCKTCTREDVRLHRLENDSVREYDRARGNRRTKEDIAKYKQANPHKVAARNAVNNAIRDGRMVKATVCEQCPATERLHAHHDDYEKPLCVRWLCAKCHLRWHAANNVKGE